MSIKVTINEYEPPITYHYSIPDGYVVRGYEGIPVMAVKATCPYWWRNPKKREARYALVTGGTDEPIALPEDAIWSPNLELDMDLNYMQYLVHKKIEESLVRQVNGQPIFAGVLKSSSLCAEAELHVTMGNGGDDEKICMDVKCYLAPKGYTAVLYLFDDNDRKHRFDTFEFKTQPLSYEMLREQLIHKVMQIPDGKITKFLCSASNIIQFPGTAVESANKKTKQGEKK